VRPNRRQLDLLREVHVAFDRTDLDFILTQILMAENGQSPVNPHLPFGLREVLRHQQLHGTGTRAPGRSSRRPPRP
jgi:hypothetical protein